MSRVNLNSFYGLLGFAIPTVIIFLAYPVLTSHLGAEKFGLFILATSISGTLAFLDFGFSVATLKFVAEDVGKGALEDVADVLLLSLVFYAILGILGMSVIWIFSDSLAKIFVGNSTVLIDHMEIVWTFRLAAIQFAVFFLTSVFISFFKGMQRFDLSSIVLSILPILTYGGAIIGVITRNTGLIGITVIGLCSNVLILLISAELGFYLCGKNNIFIRRSKLSLDTFRRMFKFGAFMTFNSISNLVLYQIQRYLIGALIGPGSVTIYVLAFTVVSKVHGVINSATESLFPLASSMNNIPYMRKIYIRMLIGSGIIAFLFLFPLAYFPKLILNFWLNNELASQVAPLLPFFALAYFFLALSPAPYHIINGIGKPKINTLFYSLNAIMNLILIGFFAWTGISLIKFVYAFAIANIFTGLLYQITAEVKIWRRELLSPKYVINNGTS